MHRREPPWQPVGVGAGIPEVGGVGGVAAAQRDDAGLACVEGPGADNPLDGVDVVADIHQSCFLLLFAF